MIKESTYSRAYAACEAFFAETGQVPTIDAIKPLIGVNSPSTISTAIKDWKSALSQAVRKDQGIDPGVPKGLLDALSGLWEQALAEAKHSLKEKDEALQAKQTALDADVAALATETARVQQWVAITEQKFLEEICYLKKEISRLAAESLASLEQVEHFRTAATAAEKENAVLSEEIRQEKEKFRRIESQYDKEHDWALKRIEEEKDSHRQKTQNEMNRLQSETTRSKQTAELLQAKVDLLVKQADVNRNRIIELERSLADEKLKLAGLTLNEARLQNKLNTKEERIRSLVNKANKKNSSHKECF